MKKLLYFIFVSLFLVACDSGETYIVDPNDNPLLEIRNSMQQKVTQDNAFAFEMLNKTLKYTDEKNVFISPLSVSIALGMAWNGAEGETKSQIETVLKMSGLSVDEINKYYRILQTELPKTDPATQLSIANALWYKNGFDIKPAFIANNKDNFNAYVKALDFSQAWALDTINNWCSKSTKGLIPTILTEISPDAVLYLMNAVYFKGIWATKFDNKLTFENSFFDENGVESPVNMMQLKDSFAYATDAYAQYIEMPYGNSAFSMTVVLPNNNKTLTDVLERLNTDNWNSTLNKMHKQDVKVYLPRFKVENKFLLNNVLKDMGMPVAFSDAANFSGISDRKICISEVIHKTYVSVDEDGTEAAAVTSIGFATSSMPTYPIFCVNRPFVFLIRERVTGVILFIGKMAEVHKF